MSSYCILIIFAGYEISESFFTIFLMKNIFFKELFIILVLFQLTDATSFSQHPLRSRPGTQVEGWADDSHYIIKIVEKDVQPVILNVNVRTGKSVPAELPKTEREKLSEILPQGVNLDRNSVISPDYNSVIFTIDNDLFLFSKGMKELKRLTETAGKEVNVMFSPCSRKIAYTVDRDLYFYDLVEEREARLTFDASGRIYNGYASWVYMEEILGRGSRYAAFWWSPDGSRIAFLRTDETDVPEFTLIRLEEADGVHGRLEKVPYPKPGDPNPKVKIGIADLATGEISWVKTDYGKDQYIAWPFWTPDGRKLAVQLVNRDQNELRIILADPASGDYTEIYREESDTWVEFFQDVYVLSNGDGFILRSSKSGWENLYHQGWDGKLISQITAFSWRVNEIKRVDEESGTIFFTGTGPESTDNHLFRAGLDGRGLIRITHGPGVHDVSISPRGSYFLDTWSNITSPGSIIAYDRRGRQVREVYDFDQPQYDPEKHSKAEMVKIATSDGLFEMPAIITYPVKFDPARKYPVIFTIYGGPDSKNIVGNKWQDLNPSWYSSNGIITFTVDHRGSGHFGRRGLEYLYRSLGKWEISDYSDAVGWLLTKPYVDGSRIGITGSSYGGYLTCLALTRGADFWTHGFANYSVTDWRLYDNIYTERFMDQPRVNPKGYTDGSVLTFAGNMKGKLYLTHGDIDDNVHMQNSIQLLSRLQDEGKSFSFMLYPGSRHGWGGPKAVSLKSEADNFWLQNFFGKD